jgi:hypothetical protein
VYTPSAAVVVDEDSWPEQRRPSCGRTLVLLYCEHSLPRSVPLSTTNPRGPLLWPTGTCFFQKHALQYSCAVLPGKDHQWFVSRTSRYPSHERRSRCEWLVSTDFPRLALADSLHSRIVMANNKHVRCPRKLKAIDKEPIKA